MTERSRLNSRQELGKASTLALGAKTASYSMWTRDCFLQGKVAKAWSWPTHLHLMLKLRMCGVIPPMGTLTSVAKKRLLLSLQQIHHSFVSLQLFLKYCCLNCFSTITYHRTVQYSVWHYSLVCGEGVQFHISAVRKATVGYFTITFVPSSHR